MKKLLIYVFGVIAFFSLSALPVRATTFDLIAPTNQLQSGQNAQFTININTEGQTITSTAVGMTYDTSVLQYVSATPGSTFSTVSTDVQDGGKLVLTGTSTSGYSGTGSFAVVTFKIIATSPGSTTVCALFNPSTPTATPAPVIPTALPKTGFIDQTAKGALLGLGFFSLAALGFFVFKEI